MGAYARWRALRRNERRLVLSSALAVGAAAAGVRIAGVRRLLRAVSRASHGRALTANQIRDRVTSVDRAGRYVPGGTCLTKSLALAWLLRRNGVAATVRIGVSTGEGFAAHAWVECDGAALNGASHHDGYSVLVG